jgi:hypothetical protein
MPTARKPVHAARGGVADNVASEFRPGADVDPMDLY